MAKRAEYVSDELIFNPIRIGVCIDEESYVGELDALNVPYWERPQFIIDGKDGTVHFFSEKSNGGEVALVCLRHKEAQTGIQLAGLICHEAVHIWQHGRTIMGEDSPSKEFEAYAIQWIFQQICWTYESLACL